MDSDNLRKLLTDTAILLALAPASLLFMGRSEILSYHGRLGLNDWAAIPDSGGLIAHGFPLFLAPAFFFALLYMGLWLYAIWQNKAAHTAPVKVPILALIASAAWLAAATSFTGIGDSSRLLVANITIVDLVALALASLIVVLIIAGAVSKKLTWRLLAGDTISGSVVLMLLTLGGLVVHASSAGLDRGSDDAWICNPYQGIQFSNTPDVPNNKTFLLVAHEGGYFFVRDPELPGNEKAVFAVSESTVLQARYSIEPARHECQT